MTPLKCLPWEWTMGPKTGQKRALSLRYPLRNWKTVKKSKKSWNQEKWQKYKNHQKHEKHKNQKKWKSRKWKNTKSNKIKKSKSDKKVSKNDTPSKTPKCHLNGTFWHFAKSEPPGWALFEFQGVPRDPVLRPKMTPSFLNGKCDHNFAFYTFLICPFYEIDDFGKVIKLMKCDKVTFFTVMQLQCNKALWRLHREGDVIITLVLPSLSTFNQRTRKPNSWRGDSQERRV